MFTYIQEELDPYTDKTGIYRNVSNSFPLTEPYRVVSIDPGRIQLVSYASKNVFPVDTSAVFRDVDNPGLHKGAYSTFEYQKETKLLSHYEWEQMQRNANPDYDAWVRSMNNFSLSSPGGATDYVDAYYASLETRNKELLRHERPLRRFRRRNARKSTLVDIAKFIVYGELLDYSTPVNHREKMAIKRKNDRDIGRAKKEGMKRFVAFGMPSSALANKVLFRRKRLSERSQSCVRY